jgi:rhodanese-related sulfurtransferase
MTKERVLMTVLVPVALICMPALKSMAAADFKTIDTAQLHSMVVDNAYRIEGGREKQFTVVDARSKQEYDEAHIFSAVSIPEGDFVKWQHLHPMSKDVLLVVYCDGTKSVTGIKWANMAAAAGYTNIAIYSEGFTAWKKKQMPVAPLSNGK